MFTNEFAGELFNRIHVLLKRLGCSDSVADSLDGILFLILIVLLAFAVSRVVYYVSLRFIKRILKIKHVPLLETLVRNKALKRVAHVLPPILISALLQMVFDQQSQWYAFTSKVTWLYFFASLLIAFNVIIKAVGDTAMERQQLGKSRPIRGLIQVIQVIVSCMILISIVAVLLNKSPIAIYAGLGGFAAVLLLIFKDSILGLVAGIQLTQNDMVRIGDWIVVPSASADGIVIDITLNTVKIQNWDNTIVTLPPYNLISNSFFNWKGMDNSDGRRITKDIYLQLDRIKRCTPEFLEKMKSFDKDLAHFITVKQAQEREGIVINTENPAGLVNGTIDTNAGLLRAYMEIYLRRHPALNRDMTMMVRTLAPTANGIPIQLYCFSKNKKWESYESISAEILEHFVSVMPHFGIAPFQALFSKK
ncbi:mechanosensitive ion channel family protein [Phocaeicola abscessus]|uniref:mechanosensitive ion channel family protein n=1 Tax=Phocaeicola abscessus TaxID=555313 RepID=UPI0003865358|nr:mechanosensitive ion channel domain-containing protein [Phocaeicola abscessus]EPT33706.1 transporter, small conductance mechanosensitive ion channel MscS family protein [Bacteroidetes bacterium oral taxon 272 str. F0290]